MKYLIAIIVLSCLSINGFAQETGPDWGRDPWHKLSNVTPESTWKSMMPSLSDHFKKDFPPKSRKSKTPITKEDLVAEMTKNPETGQTTIRWNDGSVYQGQTYYGEIKGVGTMIYPDNSKYCGSWERDLPNGKGTFQTPEGIMYTVNFENGIPHGKGVIQDLDGRKYTARWVRGVLKEKSIKPLKEKK